MSVNQPSRFPKGLFQPEKGHRFSTDSLFLSCFVRASAGDKIADIGCGCGVISIGILMRNKDKLIRIIGIDSDKQMVSCARSNAQKFEIENYFSPVLIDLRQIRGSDKFSPEQFDVAVMNPPYRELSSGRLSPWDQKNKARFEQEASLQDFINTARYLVKNKGHLYMCYLSERANYLFEVLKKYKFEPKRIKFIHGHRLKSAKIFLIHAIKNGKPSLEVEPPIFQYRDFKGKNLYTEEAIEFCPFLK